MNAINMMTWDRDSFGISQILLDGSSAQPCLPLCIPVFRGGLPAGFVDCSNGSRDVVDAGPWVATDFLGFSMENGVVHLSGEVVDVHDVLALRKIAATMPGAKAIVDDLWVSCE